MARKADTQPQNRWRSLLRMQPQSGLTIAEFCRKHRCSTAAFYAWRRKLAAQTTPANSPAVANSCAFLPVRLHQTSPHPEPVRVRLGSGAVVEIPPQQTDTLLQLVDHLERHAEASPS